MIKVKMKNNNAILTENQQKNWHYRQIKLTNMNILQKKKKLPSDQSRITKQTKFKYSPLRRAFENK